MPRDINMIFFYGGLCSYEGSEHCRIDRHPRQLVFFIAKYRNKAF